MAVRVLGYIFIGLLAVYIGFNIVAIVRKIILRRKARKIDENVKCDESKVDDSLEH